MQRIFSFLLLLFLPLAALADGMVIPTIAYPAKITIPDQRALICYSNGTERLVIETRFTGAGTNFAWVVPLPNQPVIEEATTGLFPTLQYLFRPKIIHEVPGYYIRILLAIGFIYLLRLVAKSVWNAFVIAILILIAAGLLLPATKTKSAGMSSETSSQAVSILDRKLVGVFETTTITSHDAKVLQTWLFQNGFTVPTNAAPVIASYVKDGWVFVATKVRRDKPDNETSTPHPLSFTFKTDKPVYPMRLTGVDNGSLSVELYVFGLSRAEASHFNVERCTQPNYPEPPPNDFWSWNWSPRTPETLNIVHPLLRKWVIGSPVATKLAATLSPADMHKDVWINWTPFWEKTTLSFSREGALTTALNWGAGLFAAGLFLVCLLVFASEKYKTKLSQRIGMVTVASIVFAGLIYLCLPKIEVRTVKVPRGMEQGNLFEFGEYLFNTNSATRVEISARAQQLLISSTNGVEWSNFSRHAKSMDNYLIGGHVHEEDSPGNFTLRESGNQLEFVTYDAQGAEHILPDALNLRSEH